MQNAQMPPPSSNPLSNSDEDDSGKTAKQQNSHPQVDLPAEDSHDNFQRGMPGRNIKTWGVATLGLLVAGALMWPNSQNDGIDKSKVKAAEESIADELAKRVPPKLPEIKIEAPAPPQPQQEVKIVKDNNDEEQRMALILASPMAAEIDIRSNSHVPHPVENKKVDSDIASLMRESVSTSEKMMSKYSNQGDESKTNGPHQDFLDKVQKKRLEPPLGLADARRPNTLYEGTLIRTVLTRELRTDLPGRITAKVMSDVYDSVTMNTLLIPRGSEVTCAYQSELLVGQEVVLAACHRLRLPNGKSFSLVGTPASDMQGASGLPAEVNNHFWKMFGTSFILGAASLLTSKADQQISIRMGNDGSSQMGGSIMGTTLYNTIQHIMQRNTKIAPTAIVKIGTPFTLTLARDVEMEPYTGR